MRFACVILLLLLGGCVSAKLAARVATLEATVQTVQGDLSGIKTQVGGGGDTITSWLLVVVLGGAMGALLYPIAIRPIRRRIWPEK